MNTCFYFILYETDQNISRKQIQEVSFLIWNLL